MSDETTTQAKPEDTIEQLYQQAVADIAPQTPAAEPQSQQAPETLPDALTDSDAHNKAVVHQINALKQELMADRQERQKRDVKLQEDANRRDFQDAVNRLVEKANVPEAQKELAAGYLLQKATTSKALQGLWQGRGDKPEAFSKAIDALVPALQDALSIKLDPQIAENQRALDDAMKSQTTSSGTPPEESHEDKILKMDKGQFEAEWRKIKGEVW